MKIKFIALLLIPLIDFTYGQSHTDTIFIDSKLNRTNSVDYKYMRVIKNNSDLRFLVSDFIPTGELKREYEYLSKKKYEPVLDDFVNIFGNKALKLDGKFTSYLKSGEMDFEIEFKNGRTIDRCLSLSEDGEELFTIIEDIPEYPGGMDSLRSFVSSELIYPKIAYENKIQGEVLLQFIVSKDGNVGKVNVINSVHPLLDKEAIRVIESCGKWMPGKCMGRPVDVFFTFPINFTIPKIKDDE